MSKNFQQQLAAEQMGIKIRWVLLAGVALIGFAKFSEVWFSCGFALLGVSNVVGWQACRKPAIYAKFGRHLMAILRLIDIVTLTSLSFIGPFQDDNLWLLTIPAILSEGLISRSLVPVVRLTVFALALPVYHAIITKGDGVGLSAITTMALAAFGGVILRGYRDREQALQARDERLDTVLNCAAALAASTDLRSMISHTLKACTKELDACCGYVMLTSDEEPGKLKTESAYSVEGVFDFPKILEVGAGITGYAVKMGQPIAIHNNEDEQLEIEGISLGARSIVSVPLVARNYMGPAQASNEQILGQSLWSAMPRTVLRAPATCSCSVPSPRWSRKRSRMRTWKRGRRTTFLMTLARWPNLWKRVMSTRGATHSVFRKCL